tara:strand:- start:1079 stop:1384 length:306 start_codon:yes stop_codon:yes gene_type:complete
MTINQFRRTDRRGGILEEKKNKKQKTKNKQKQTKKQTKNQTIYLSSIGLEPCASPFHLSQKKSPKIRILSGFWRVRFHKRGNAKCWLLVIFKANIIQTIGS